MPCFIIANQYVVSGAQPPQVWAQVLDELQRYYPAPIVLLNERAAQQNVSGSYQLDDPQAVVQALVKVTASHLTRLPGGALLIR